MHLWWEYCSHVGWATGAEVGYYYYHHSIVITNLLCRYGAGM